MNSKPDLPPRLDEPAGRWGPWQTAGFFAAAFGAYIAVESLAVIALIVFRSVSAAGKGLGIPDPNRLMQDPMLLTVSTLVAVPVTVGAVLWFAGLRKALPAREYLGLGRPPWSGLGRWLGVVFGYLLVLTLVGELAHRVLGRPLVSEFMAGVFAAGGRSPWLHVAVLVGAPLNEEFLFRGLLFTGLADSRIGPAWAAAISSALWTVIHLQYDWLDLGALFVLGLILAAAWWRTRSLWVCVAIHAVVNLTATVEMFIRGF